MQVPETLDRSQQRVWVLYEGNGCKDRGVPMSRVIAERPPVAILSLESMMQTDLGNGNQQKVGRSSFRADNSLSFFITAWPTDRYHYIAFEDMQAALEYIKEKHPRIPLLPAYAY